MSTITVLDNTTKTKLGTGEGNIHKSTKTATIDAWKNGDKAGLQAGKKYTLKSDGKVYDNTECTVVGLPATFKNVQ